MKRSTPMLVRTSTPLGPDYASEPFEAHPRRHQVPADTRISLPIIRPVRLAKPGEFEWCSHRLRVSRAVASEPGASAWRWLGTAAHEATRGLGSEITRTARTAQRISTNCGRNSGFGRNIAASSQRASHTWRVMFLGLIDCADQGKEKNSSRASS